MTASHGSNNACADPPSVDPTDARKATVRCFGRSDRSRLISRDEITPDKCGVMVGSTAQFRPGVCLGLGEESGRIYTSARTEHYRRRMGRGRRLNLTACPFPRRIKLRPGFRVQKPQARCGATAVNRASARVRRSCGSTPRAGFQDQGGSRARAPDTASPRPLPWRS